MVAPQPFYEDRGTPIAIKHVLEALAEVGFEVDVLTYPLGQAIDLPGIRMCRIRNPFHIRQVRIGWSIQKLLFDVILTAAIWKRLPAGNYSFVHAVEEAAFPAVLIGRHHNVPVIYDMQSSLPEQMKKHLLFRSAPVQTVLRLLERWLLHNADLVVCSAGLEEYVHGVEPSALVREWYFPSRHVHVSAEEVKQLRKTLRIADHSRVVLYTGTFEPYQGLSDLIDAVSGVLDCAPDTVFVLVGASGSTDYSFSARAGELCERGALRILPRQPRTVMPFYLAMADVVVSPRRAGGNLPLKIFDYMAAGRPIVAFDSLTNRTVLNDERALLVGHSTGEFAGAIVRLLQDPAGAERLGAAAKAYAETRLGRNAFANLVSELHDLACQAGRRSSGPGTCPASRA